MQEIIFSEDPCRDLATTVAGNDCDRLFILTDEHTYLLCRPLLDDGFAVRPQQGGQPSGVSAGVEQIVHSGLGVHPDLGNVHHPLLENSLKRASAYHT